jgi:hypothetical protein
MSVELSNVAVSLDGVNTEGSASKRSVHSLDGENRSRETDLTPEELHRELAATRYVDLRPVPDSSDTRTAREKINANIKRFDEGERAQKLIEEYIARAPAKDTESLRKIPSYVENLHANRMQEIIAGFKLEALAGGDSTAPTAAAVADVADADNIWRSASVPVANLCPEYQNGCYEYIGSDDSKGDVTIYEYLKIVGGEDGLRRSADKKNDQGTANSGNAQTAATDARKVRGGSGSGSGSGSKGSVGESRAGSKVGTSLTTVLDIFVALMQKLGVWVYNLIPNLDVTLPAFTLSMSWLQFPAIGWELTLALPALATRGWLYWTVLIAGISLPFVLGGIIFTDKGDVRKAVPRFAGLPTQQQQQEEEEEERKKKKTVVVGDDADAIPDAEKQKVNTLLRAEVYQAHVQGSQRKFCLAFGVLFVLFIALGVIMSDGQLLGLAVLALMVVMVRLIWDYAKNYLLEAELATHNRMLAPSYRSMRVFVNSTVFLMILRSIYIMTISALCQVIMDPQDSDGGISIEAVFAYIMIAPVMVAFPFFVYREGHKFQTKYVNALGDMPTEAFRGWLVNFPARETSATMLECTISSLFMPFEREMWYFAVLQLCERALATVFATVLVSNSLMQVSVAIVIELSLGLSEAWFKPFTDDLEDMYNVIWRVIAGSILLVMLLLDIVEGFAGVGDVLLLLLTLTALGFFLYAIDIPRLMQGFKHTTAVSAFRKHELAKMENSSPVDESDEEKTMGSLGVHHASDMTIDVAGTLLHAIAEIPAGVSPDEVVRDAFSFAQQYKLVCRASEDNELFSIMLEHGLMWKTTPLLSLDGCRLGGPIPVNIGMFSNVVNLSMTDMALDDSCSLAPLATLHRLRSLALDENLFAKQIKGLDTLTKLEKLSLRNLTLWEGDDAGTRELTQAIIKMPQLHYLDTAGTDNFAKKGPISFEFVKFVNEMVYDPDVKVGENYTLKDGTFVMPNGRLYNAIEKYDAKDTHEQRMMYAKERFFGKTDLFSCMPFLTSQYNSGGVTMAQYKKSAELIISPAYKDSTSDTEPNLATVQALAMMEERTETGYGMDWGVLSEVHSSVGFDYSCNVLQGCIRQLLDGVSVDTATELEALRAVVEVAGVDPTEAPKPGAFDDRTVIRRLADTNPNPNPENYRKEYPAIHEELCKIFERPSPVLIRKTSTKIAHAHTCWDCFVAMKYDAKDINEPLTYANCGTITKNIHISLWRCPGQGKPPLFWAAHQGKTLCVSELLSAGADPNAAHLDLTSEFKEFTPSSCLMTATEQGFTEIADLLSANGAKMELPEMKKEEKKIQTENKLLRGFGNLNK